MNYRCLLIKRMLPDGEGTIETAPFLLTPETTIAQINDIIEWFTKGTQLITIELSYHYTTASAMQEVEKFKANQSNQ